MSTIEKSTVKETRPDGSKIILPEVELTIRNSRTGVEYASEDEARADIDNPDTDTTEEDVARDVTLRILKGVDSEGGSG